MPLIDLPVSVRADHTGLEQAGFSSTLDAMRWAAALAVLLMHATWTIFDAAQLLVTPGLAPKAFLAVTSLGHQAVVVFFVLSGYLVGGRSLVAAAQGRFQFREYLAARVARLYVVLLPALMLTVIADTAGARLSDQGGFYAAADRHDHGWGPLLLNVAMLQSFLGPTYGSNAPLWSLSYEFWFYMAFGAALQFFAAPRRYWFCLLAIGLISVVLGPRFLQYFLIWLLGALAAVAPNGPGRRVSVTLLLLGLIAAIGTARVLKHQLGAYPTDCVVTLAMTGFLWALKGRPLHPMVKLRAANSALAEFSYSLYAVHFPVLLLMLSVAGGPAAPGGRSMALRFGWESLLLHGGVVAGGGLVGWAFSLLTERRTGRVRRSLVNAFSPRQPDVGQSH